MKKIEDLKVQIFADGADKDGMLEMHNKSFVKGLTTNPTLMKKVGIKDYAAFCKDILTHIKKKPLSFEVFSDDFSEMERQALEIASWGENVYVKIPITNTRKELSYGLVKKLADQKVKLNVTALMTLEQVRSIAGVLDRRIPSYVSIFAGRIADTGLNPIPILKDSLAIQECLRLGIPTICIVDTNCNPDLIPYPIPANDDSSSSIDFILNYLANRISSGYNKVNKDINASS
jgi:transaldolase